MPPVRLIRRREEVSDVWVIIRTNIRSAGVVEMDMRSLVIGAHIAEAKLVELIGAMGPEMFAAAVRSLYESADRVLRARVSDIEDGSYDATAWVEWGEKLFRIPCRLVVDGARLIFDLRDAPPQVPHFFNSKEYIIRAVAAPLLKIMLAPGLPLNQALYDLVEIESTPGTLVASLVPAPVAAAHMDAAGAVAAALTYCLQLAIHVSLDAWGREYNTGPEPSAYGTARWSYVGADGMRQALTIIDGAFAGSSAGASRDGIDLQRTLIPAGINLEYADIEIMETAYPLLFHHRGSRTGAHGHGQFRSGAGCEESFSPHGVEQITGNMTGTKSWLPPPGAAGGLPGATTKFQVTRADGAVEPVAIQAVGVTLTAGDRFGMMCASGGGFGDPLDRALAALHDDLADHHLTRADAEAIYGVVFTPDGEIDEAATERRREAVRRQRLAEAKPAVRSRQVIAIPDEIPTPIYPGVVQRGCCAVAEQSGALLAVAPDNWLDGCPTLDQPVGDGREVVARAHLDPVSGRMLHVDVVPVDNPPTVAIMPRRWTG
jgi:N-methylhydantoinase B